LPIISFLRTRRRKRRVDDTASYPRYIPAAGPNNGDPTAPTSTAAGSERLVAGRNAWIYSAETPRGGSRQVWLYDLDGEVYTQLTHDAGNKGAVHMWQAPEFGSDFAFFTIVDHSTIHFYRCRFFDPGNEMEIERVREITAPSGAPRNIWSAEPFIFDRRSYVFMVRSPNADPLDKTQPTQIWLASMTDPAINHEISDSANHPDIFRSDPEVCVTSNGPYVYYSVYNTTGNNHLPTDGVVWRASTGLSPG
jgi:hypothetical protein